MDHIKALCEILVANAINLGVPSHKVYQTFEEAMDTMKKKEAAANVQKLAQVLTFESAEDKITDAVSQFWDGDDMDELEEALRLRFPKHYKKIDKIIALAGDASNEREEMGKHGPSAAYEKLYDKVVKGLKELPWEK